MPVIPINPSSIASAVPYILQGSATPCALSDRPPEGHKFIPMQIGFADAPVKLVDFSSVTPTQPFSKVSSIYVDNTNSTHDVTIMFPDSGFQTRVAFGDTAMVTPLASNATPRFYVILDSGNQTSATDSVNIFALNFYVPPYETTTFQRSVAYGYSSYFALQPTFTQSQSFHLTQGNPVLNTKYSVISNSQWYLTTLFVTATTFNSVYQSNITLYDGNNIITEFLTNGQSGTVAYNFPPLSGMNFISSGSGNLSVSATVNASYILNFSVTAMGGVLVT
jgi:hypothetical protein